MISKDAAKKQLTELKEFYSIYPEDMSGIKTTDKDGNSREVGDLIKVIESQILRSMEKGLVEFSNGNVVVNLYHKYKEFPEGRIVLKPCSAANQITAEKRRKELDEKDPRYSLAEIAEMGDIPLDNLISLMVPDLGAMTVLARFLSL